MSALTEDMKQYFNIIHPNISKRSQLRVFRLLKGGQTVNQYFPTVAGVIAYATGLNDTYAGVVPYQSMEGGLCASSSTLWVDVDTCGAEEDLPAVEGLPEASMVVYTGRGIHLYWKLDTPVPLADMEAYNRGLSIALGGDHCWDRKRVLRLPMTINSKTGKMCHILRHTPNTFPSSDFSLFYAPPSEPLLVAPDRESVPYENMPAWWKSLVEHGGRSSSAVYSFKDGVLDNSHMIFNIINVAKREGMSTDDIYGIYERGGAGFEKLRDGNPQSAYRYIERVYSRCTPS
jgi:hypothetical protein